MQAHSAYVSFMSEVDVLKVQRSDDCKVITTIVITHAQYTKHDHMILIKLLV